MNKNGVAVKLLAIHLLKQGWTMEQVSCHLEVGIKKISKWWDIKEEIDLQAKQELFEKIVENWL